MRVRNITPDIVVLPTLGVELAPGEEADLPDSACCAALVPVERPEPPEPPEPPTTRRRGATPDQEA